jgi:hypothetical protein
MSLQVIVQSIACVVSNAEDNAVAEFLKPPLTPEESEAMRRGTEERYANQPGTSPIKIILGLFILGSGVALWWFLH